MKKNIYILIFIFFAFKAQSYENNYKNISKIEMNILRNNELIGHSNYIFTHSGNKMNVTNNTQFEVKLFGLKVFSIISKSIENYENNKLVFFKSNTLQNDKKKYANLIYDKKINKFIIDGSSYKGKADVNNVIGNWWNHKILEATSQISPLSGSIKKQIVNLIKRETLIINGKSYETLHFKLKSKDESLPDDKKLDFNIWLDINKGLIIKVAYKRLGSWEYILKKVE